MRLIQFFGSFAIISAAFAGFASDANAAAKVAWTKAADGIVCAQLGADGSVQRTVDDSFCIKSVGAKVEWKNGAEGVVCAEETPAGDFLQIIDNSYCVKRLGTKTAWVNSPEGVVCASVTPQGGAIQTVDSSQCTGAPIPAPTPEPTPLPITPPTPDQGGAKTPQQPPQVVQQTPGYHWSDASKTMCILYNDQGIVAHMAPPAMCTNAF